MGADMSLLRAVLAWLLLTQAASAAEEAMALRGVGITSCAQFAKLYAGDPKYVETVFFSWAQGYWSSQNTMLLLQKQYRELA
jgi:hypothetical protein